MTTASGLPWVSRLADDRAAYAIAQAHGIPEIIARLIAARGVGMEEAAQYLAPTLKGMMPDPFVLQDMEKAARRVADAVTGGERIAIFGDYDVDGATSSAILTEYLRALGVEPLTYIPDRMKEGYGPNIPAFDTLIDAGARLIITVDCGTLAFAPIDHANARGAEVVILDHHTAEARLPDAITVNPNRLDDRSGLGMLAAVGVTFLFLVALNRELRGRGHFSSPRRGEDGRGALSGADSQVSSPPNLPPSGGGIELLSTHHEPNLSPHSRECGTPHANKEPNLLALLDRVALGTVADVVPLKGLNRAFVTQGLKLLAQRGHTGLAALMDAARMHEPPGTYHLGFLLGPRINAGGRVGESGLGLRLLTTRDRDEASALAATLSRYNEERQAIEASVLERALALAEAQANLPVILVAGEGWHPGVIGIVAARLKEKWQRPAAVISLEEGAGKASARSVFGADFGAAIHAAHAAGLIEAGGGHAMAAGFSLRADQIEGLHHFLIARLGPAVEEYTQNRAIRLDGWLSVAGATEELLGLIEQAGPYGAGNPSPRFALREVKIVHRSVMKEKHLRLVVTDGAGAARLTAVAFNVADTPLGAALTSARPRIHLAGELKRNVWQGRASLQFIIEDAAWE